MSRRATVLVRALVVVALVTGAISVSPVVADEHAEGEEGPQVWSHTYQRGGIHDAVAVPDGYVLVGYYHPSGNFDVSEAWAAKIDHDGNVVWRRSFEGTDVGILYGVDAAPDGGTIAVGKRNASSRSDRGQMWAVRLDGDGGVEWERTFGSGELFDVAISSYGEAVAVGQSWMPFPEGFAVAFSDDGDESWRRKLGGEELRVVVSDRAGAVFLAAGTDERRHGWIEGARAIALWKNGDVRWDRFYGNATPGATAIQRREDGVVLAGERTVIYANHRGIARNVTRLDELDGEIQAFVRTPRDATVFGTRTGRQSGALARYDAGGHLERRVGSGGDRSIGRVEALVPVRGGRYLAVGMSQPIYDRGFAYLTDQVPPTPAVSATPNVAETGVTEVTLDASSSTDNTAVQFYRWDFDGNGSVDVQSTEPTATRVYDRLGTVNATVTAIDSDGNHANASVGLTLEDTTPPEAGLSAPSPRFVATTAPARLDASASTDNHRVVEYRWDFDGNGTIDAVTDGPRVRHRFDGGGLQFVELTVVDAVGHATTRTFTLETVPNDGPPNVTVDVGLAVVGDRTYFEANVTDRVGTPTVTWTFPNGTTRTGPVATYVFERAGTQNVSVVVADEYGAERRTNVTVDVREYYPPDDAGGAVGRALGVAFLVYGAVGLFLVAVLVGAVYLGLMAVVRWLRGGEG